MRRASAVLFALATSCSSTRTPTSRAVESAGRGFQERFVEATLSPGWVATLPSVVGAEVRIDQGALRLALPNGSEASLSCDTSSTSRAIQGRGITPDHVVHPTLEGVRAGRDEILEAGVAVAQRLITP